MLGLRESEEFTVLELFDLQMKVVRTQAKTLLKMPYHRCDNAVSS